MSASHHAVSRQSPPAAVKRPILKSTRSAASAKLTPKGVTSKNKGPKGKEDHLIGSDKGDEEDDMATSFLQYCAMCEKQIVVPNSSILYCSESCRRQDANGSPPVEAFINLTLTSPTKSWDRMTDYLMGVAPFPAKMQKPFPFNQHQAIDSRIPPVDHEGKSDLDPTEWKPADEGDDDGGKPESVAPETTQAYHHHRHCRAHRHVKPGRSSSSEDEPTAAAASVEMETLPGLTSPSSSSLVSAPASASAVSLTTTNNSWKPKMVHRPSSEAFAYLSQFHRSADNLNSGPRTRSRRLLQLHHPRVSGDGQAAVGAQGGPLLPRTLTPELSYSYTPMSRSSANSSRSSECCCSEDHEDGGIEMVGDGMATFKKSTLSGKEEGDLITSPPSVTALPTTALSTGQVKTETVTVIKTEGVSSQSDTDDTTDDEDNLTLPLTGNKAITSPVKTTSSSSIPSSPLSATATGSLKKLLHLGGGGEGVA